MSKQQQFTDAVIAELAAKSFNTLSDEVKEQLLRDAVFHIFKGFSLSWEHEKAIKSLATKYIIEYVGQPDIQEKIRASAISAVDKFMEKLFLVMTHEVETIIRRDWKKIMDSEVG
jgi:hypothetical protein